MWLGEGTRGQEGPYKWGAWGSITAQLRGTDVLPGMEGCILICAEATRFPQAARHF